jgi:hypothetical protein
MRRCALALLAGAAWVAAPAAAQLSGPADPSGNYPVTFTTIGSQCPLPYPRAEVLLQRQSANEVAVTIAGSTTTALYQRDRAALQGVFAGLFGDTAVALSGTVDEFQGQKTLDLNLRWTGVDCLASGSGSIAGASPAGAAANASEVPTDVTAPPPTVIGPAGSEAVTAPAGPTATGGTATGLLAGVPFWVKLVLVVWAAILLGWLLGKALARRSS